jgi:hypothetical protein
MNLSDVVRLKQASEDDPLELTNPIEKTDAKTDFMNIRRKVQPAQALTEQARTTADNERGINNLIKGLVDLLPKPGSDWSLDDRAKWFRLAVGIFDLGYNAADGKDREISIAFVTHGLPKKEIPAPLNRQLT